MASPSTPTRNPARLLAVALTATALGCGSSTASPRASEGGPPSAPAGTTRAALLLPKNATGRNPIKTVRAQMARLAGDLHVVGTVSFDADHFAVVGPLVPGRVARLGAGVGSTVVRGQVMADIESAEVGEARGELISARARCAAAEANLRRERELADKRISSAREREVAEAQWAGELATMRAAEEKLRAFGLSDADVRAAESKTVGGRVAIRAPIDGTVIERSVTLGEAVERAATAFKVADLSRVWILLELYEKDLARVRVGQAVEATTEPYPGELFPGRVAYLAPVIDQATRTAKVRVEIANSGRKLHIGQLMNARLVGDSAAAAAPVLTVPRDAVQRVDGKPLVFVKMKDLEQYQRRPVELGVSGGDLIEIRSGLQPGEELVSDGAFLLKSELLR